MGGSPREKYQLWPQMIIVWLITFVGFSALMLYITWDMFHKESWGGIEKHLPYWKAIIFYFFPIHSPYEWIVYWREISLSGLKLQFFLHLLFPLASSIFIAFYMTRSVLWVEGGREKMIHLSGPKLLSKKSAVTHAKKMHASEISSNKLAKDGIHIHPEIKISTLREQFNFLILGTTGGGKSTVIKAMLEFVINRGDHSFIYDEKKEYTRDFFVEDEMILIAPWDKRGSCWDISKDIETYHDASLVAKCLIPVAKSEDEMWIKGAQLLFTEMIAFLLDTKSSWDWRDLAKMLTKPQGDMLEILIERSSIATSFIQENSKTTQGFYVNLIASLSWINDLANIWGNSNEKRFSIKDWISINSNKKVVIVQSDPRLESVGAPLCNALISIMTRHYLSLPDRSKRKTWLFIDEAGNLPPNPDIKKWLELSRSRGARSVIGTQSISQLKELYGLNNTDAILNLLSIVISLRMGAAGDDAKYTANIFSERVVSRPTSLEANASWQTSTEPVVEPSALIQLKADPKKGVEGYLFIPDWGAVYQLTWPLFNAKKIILEHSPADWFHKNVSLKTNRLKKGDK